ncbi:MAG: hypothetical protein R3C45_07575 [Phycisphaerales bacterium]
MLDFSDLPYQYFPPKRNALVSWAIGVFNRYNRLPKVLKVDRVEVTGIDKLKQTLRRRGAKRDRVLFLPNHPTHRGTRPSSSKQSSRRHFNADDGGL